MASSTASTETASRSKSDNERPDSLTEEKNGLEPEHISRDTPDTNDAEKQIYIAQDATSAVDENIIWWDGDSDPENPYNWPRWRKVLNCVLISCLAFITPLASCMKTKSNGATACHVYVVSTKPFSSVS